MARPKEAIENYGYVKIADNSAYHKALSGPDKVTIANNTTKAVESYGQLAYNVGRLTKMVNEYGTEAFDAFGSEASDLESVRTDILMNLKDVYGLGAPQAGDLALLEKSIADPTAFMTSGGTFLKRLKTQMDTHVNKIQNQSKRMGIELNDFYAMA